MKKHKVTLSVTYSDTFLNNKPALPPSIDLDIGRKHIAICPKSKTFKHDVEKGNIRIYRVTKAVHKRFLQEAEKIIRKYHGKPIHISSKIVYNVPLEEIRDTALMKFVLKKLKIKA